MPLIVRILTLAVLVGAFVGGCDSKPPAEREKDPQRVTATIYPLADVVRTVGGKRVNVQWLIEIGQSLDSPPADAHAKLSAADLTVARGAGDEWALGRAEDPMRANDFVQVDLLPSSGGRTGYLWLDPVVIKEFAGVVCQRLSARDPMYQGYFRDNEQAFAKQVDDIVNEFAPRLAAKTNKKEAALTGEFAPVAERFGITLTPASPLPTQRLTDEQIRVLRKTASDNGITTLFVPADRTPAVQRDLANRTGLTVLTLDPLGSSAPTGRSSYLQILRYNLEQLDKGLK